MNRIILINLFRSLILGALTLTMLILGTSMLSDNINRDLKKTKSVSGVLEKTEVIVSYSRGAHSIPVASKHLAIKLISVDHFFGTYNPSQQYSELRKKLLQGNEIKMFYYNSHEEFPKNNVFQIEINGEAVLKNKVYAQNHIISAISIICFGLLVLFLLLRTLRKRGIRRKW